MGKNVHTSALRSSRNLTTLALPLEVAHLRGLHPLTVTFKFAFALANSWTSIRLPCNRSKEILLTGKLSSKIDGAFKAALMTGGTPVCNLSIHRHFEKLFIDCVKPIFTYLSAFPKIYKICALVQRSIARSCTIVV